MESIVIVGNGMVGHQLVEQLVAGGSHLQKRIVVIGEERFIAYDRVHLSGLFAGQSHQDLLLSSEEWYQKLGIELLLGVAVVAVDRVNKTLTLEDDTQLHYDQLVFATGSYPFVPPMPGSERKNVFVYRTLDDLSQIKQACVGAKTGAVIGGGLLGLEAANALRLLGLETHVVEFAPRLMPVQLDEGAGTVLKSKIEQLGLTVHTATATEKIIDGESAYHRMVFKDAAPLEVDVILFSAGIRPRDQLARDCGIEIGERGGIVINDACQTSDAAIYAIGECALWQGKIFGLVAPGYAMARVLAQQLQGISDAAFTGTDMSTKLKLLGVDVASIGDAHKATPNAQEMVLHDAQQGIYKKLVVDQSGTQLLGAILIGDNQDYDALLQSYLNQTPLPQPAVSLLFDSSALKGDVSDSAVICSCHNVTKGDLIGAIHAGAQDLTSLKAQTKAGTGCGGCSAMVKSVLDEQLSLLGVEVSNQLCEHFSHTRQALYHICQVEAIRDFSTLISKHGKGRGCDICKPTAGSIFSSLWNEHIMESKHAPLQDSNDAFMANLQKDGSYSIVPRIPGGEITPEKLIALGEVAREYDLYTKITGGQRVDLFGAQVEQLPQIWQTLIEAGFETGHAYGKSVRTVKSCVGSTWCRYGVDDSVGLAIELENRYKGLRAPHKLKFAVSGCTRECAEAQSKDIGVIATENGWNLYVCGNGGMRPRHADLLAADLSKAQLIALIDRVLIFYVRTADRLQRTSVWLENLEGGLEYLKSVVLDDSLALCQQLEQQMAHIVDTYHCEWQQTLNDPEKLIRFRPFINSDKASVPLAYQRTRGQRIPSKQED